MRSIQGMTTTRMMCYLTTKILLVLDEKVISLVSSSHSVLRPGFFERYGMVNKVNHGDLSIRELQENSGLPLQ